MCQCGNRFMSCFRIGPLFHWSVTNQTNRYQCLSVRIYLYSNCSSCRDALAMFQDAGLDPEVRDIFRDKLTSDEIGALLSEIDRKPSEVLSTRSTPYRELGLATQNPTEDELVA